MAPLPPWKFEIVLSTTVNFVSPLHRSFFSLQTNAMPTFVRMMEKSRYEAVIGLEMHIQLATQSKAFCSDAATFGAEPNTQTGIISLAHPGTLPRLNRKQLTYAIRLGLAIGSDISRTSYFDRKHYFYPDLPKGFQTTQDNRPICVGGMVQLRQGDIGRSIRINRIHMEEDAGKSLHELSPSNSMIDLNRAGVPLLELVTEPDFRSADEVYLFINKLRQLVRYLDISDGNMEEGSLRCDCNISIRKPGQQQLNARCEVKNINSARFARKAINLEIVRQAGIMDAGGQVTQETREYDPVADVTRPLRGKEDAHDYRYFPEPDIPLLQITQEEVDLIRAQMPMLPDERADQYRQELHLSAADAAILTETKEHADLFDRLCTDYSDLAPPLAAKFFINKWMPEARERKLTNGEMPPLKEAASLLRLIQSKKIVQSVAYQKLWPAMLTGGHTVDELVEQLDLVQTDDRSAIVALAQEVIAENPEQLAKYKRGKKNLLTFFMGQLMRKSRGKAKPDMAREVLQALLEEG